MTITVGSEDLGTDVLTFQENNIGNDACLTVRISNGIALGDVVEDLLIINNWELTDENRNKFNHNSRRAVFGEDGSLKSWYMSQFLLMLFDCCAHSLQGYELCENEGSARLSM